jgi:hypothetical protein
MSSNKTPKQHVSQCQSITKRFATDLITDYLKEVDEKLMEFSDKARSNVQQMQLMALTGDLKKKRKEIESIFQVELSMCFEKFLTGKLTTNLQTAEDNSPSLSLVANDALEEDIALQSFIRKADTRFNESLFSLNQRFAMLVGGRKLDDGGMPIAPVHFAESLHAAVIPLELEAKMTVLFYKLFEKTLFPKLDDLYEEVNNYLIQQGILPNLKYNPGQQTQKNPAQPTAPGTNAQQPVAPEPTAPPSAMQNQAQPQQYSQNLSGQQPAIPSAWLGQITQPMPIAVPQEVAASITPPDPHQPSPVYQQELLGAIRTMQQAMVRQMPMPRNNNPASQSELINALNNVQQINANPDILDAPVPQPCETVLHLGSTAASIQQQVNTESGKDVEENDANIIDLVGMTFEFMLSDDNLPDNVKAVLSYMHTPYLKVAFLDTEMFGKPEHPARQLLDILAETGTKWVTADGSSQFKAFPKIKAVVRRVLMEFNHDLSLFDELLTEMKEFHEKVARNVELLEKRAAEKAEGEEKLRQVKRLVNRSVKEKIRGEKLPSPIIVLLLHPWSEYMTFVLLRNGEDSQEWKDCLATIDDVLWSIQPKSDADEQKKLMEIREDLEAELQEAFQSIAYDQAKGNKLLDALQQLQVIALKNKLAQPAPENIREEIEATAVGKTEAEEIEELESIEISKDEQSIIDKLKMVEFGTWIAFGEFQELQNPRLKIAWFNSKTSRYMLVDRAGKQVATVTALEIARHMLNKNAEIVSGTSKPFFERALENIFKRLHSSAAA